jgi:two-component system sensor kinase FixL
VIGTLSSGIDITERKKAERELLIKENAMASSIDGMAIADLQGKVTYVNRVFVKMWGYGSDKEIVGKSIAEMTQKGQSQGKADEIVKALGTKGGWAGEIAATRKDGSRFYAILSASLVKDEAGKPICMLSSFVDITERKNMEEKLEEYSKNLEELVEKRTRQLEEAQTLLVKSEKLAAIGQVAAMVGHDLRNPLTGISGAAYYLKMKLGANAEKKMKEMLEIIEKNIQYSNKIITDLMDYSREIRLELTETTPKSIITESISLVQVPEKVQLTDSTQNEPRIRIDVDRMKRVFANFIKNAVEAMPQGGELAISSRVSGSDVEFTFIDTGVGMANEVLEKIWTPFFTTKAKGMGLGLPICKRIVEAHQGKISVESIVGEGTTFTITIPLEPKPRVEGGEKVWVNVPESLLSTTTKP